MFTDFVVEAMGDPGWNLGLEFVLLLVTILYLTQGAFGDALLFGAIAGVNGLALQGHYRKWKRYRSPTQPIPTYGSHVKAHRN